MFGYIQYAVKTKRNLIHVWLLGAVVLQALTSEAQTVTRVAAGYAVSLFLKSDGSLWGMGGFGTTNLSDRPVQIVASNVTAIAAGAYHVLFLKSDGSLWAMGNNQYGELGNGTYITTNLPEQIVASNVTAIAAGYYHSLFLKSDGSLWGMGYNESGQLGDGTSGTMNETNLPEQIMASNVTAIAAGAYHSLFLMSDGSLWGMGDNGFYSCLGNAPNGFPYSYTDIPVQIVASNVTTIGAGYYFTLLLKNDGSFWGMGENDAGQLGNGTYNNVEVPEQIPIPYGNVTAFAGGDLHCLFLHGDGSLWATGFNQYGQLGDGTYNPTNLPELIVAGNVTAIAAGAYHSLFVKSDGSLWAMGYNAAGQLGDGTTSIGTNQPELIVAAPVVVTNNVTFIVDMSVQAGLGNFSVADAGPVFIRGDFSDWDLILMTNTNNPDDANDFYTTITLIGDEGSPVYFQYVMASGQPFPQLEPEAGNRTLTLVSPSGNYTNGPVYFNNQGPSDFVTVTNCLVTFTVDMTPAINSGAFDEAVDQVFVNGLDNGIADSWWSWGPLGGPPQYAMTEIGGTELYTITVPVNQWQPLELTYKYSIDGQDNEAGYGDNHSRYIRRFPNYAMPTDVFGSQGTTSSTEPSFGPAITINCTNNQVWLSWLGRPGVGLQSTTSLTPPIVWQPMPLTDGTNLFVGQGTGIATTNFTVGTSNLFWELIGPQ